MVRSLGRKEHCLDCQAAGEQRARRRRAFDRRQVRGAGRLQSGKPLGLGFSMRPPIGFGIGAEPEALVGGMLAGTRSRLSARKMDCRTGARLAALLHECSMLKPREPALLLLREAVCFNPRT